MKRPVLVVVTGAILVPLAVVLFLRLGPWRAGGATPAVPMQAAGDLQIGAGVSPDPPRTGENALVVVVKDRDGRPVAGATVEALVSMEAMGAMPRMESRARFSASGPGVYRGRFGLAMAGDWGVTLRVTVAARAPVELSYRLSTNAAGLAPEGGAAIGATGAAGATPTSAGAGPGDSTLAVATVRLDDARRQALGLRFGTVVRRDLALQIKAPGKIGFDDSRRADVALKYNGWVREVRADFTGRRVRRNEILFTSYSPEVVSTQQEYLEALAGGTDTMRTAMGAHDDLAAAARRRLERWDVPPSVIDDLERTRRPLDAVPVLAPVSGVVVEKNVVAGSAFTAGTVLYRVAPDDPAWVLASVYQADLEDVHIGQTATLVDPYRSDHPRRGTVAFVYPTVDADTRAGQVRIEVPNEDGDLKSGMFVDVAISVPLGSRLAVPESAVLPTGTRNVVFVDLGDGRLEPRDVALGAHAEDWVEVRSGLKEGERVVTSGNFLLAAESRLKSAAGKW